MFMVTDLQSHFGHKPVIYIAIEINLCNYECCFPKSHQEAMKTD